MKKNLVIGLIISGICVFFAVRGINFSEVAASLKSASYGYLVPVIIVVVLGLYLRCYRWGIILRSLASYDQKTLFSIGSIGFMAVCVLPARLGEFARPYLVKRKSGVRMSATMATIIVERVFDLLALMLVLFAVLLKVSLPPEIFKAGITMLTISFSLFVVLIFLAVKKEFSLNTIERITIALPPRIKQPLLRLAHSFIEGLQMLPDIKKTLYVGALSFVIWLVVGLSNYVLFFAFSFDLSLINAYAILVVVALGVMLPAAPGFVGTYHYACVLGLTAFGISKSAAFSYAVALHFIQLVPVIMLGLIFLPLEHLSLAQVVASEASEDDGNGQQG
ncbi:MAG: flippase-like domain-containing protein [Desulfobacterota bacterium]|nr:flippase-like domain-containing protein [Thermodesulfobacteriota bacterium]